MRSNDFNSISFNGISSITTIIGDLMSRDMMLTVDEYMALRRLISSERESKGTELATTELIQKNQTIKKTQDCVCS